MNGEHDAETLLFAARVLREVADILEGEDETGAFMTRWREYERVQRSVDLRSVDLDDEVPGPPGP